MMMVVKAQSIVGCKFGQRHVISLSWHAPRTNLRRNNGASNSDNKYCYYASIIKINNIADCINYLLRTQNPLLVDRKSSLILALTRSIHIPEDNLFPLLDILRVFCDRVLALHQPY